MTVGERSSLIIEHAGFYEPYGDSSEGGHDDDPPPFEEVRRRRPSLSESIGESVRLLVDTALHFDGATCSIRSIKELGGDASVPSEIVNVAKNLIGAGVLSLSGGIAMYANSPRAILSASIWIMILGIIFGYFCLIIAKVCHIRRASTYRECWELTMGETGSIAVSMAYALKPAMGNLAYSTILSQTLQSLLHAINIDASRIFSLWLVTVMVLLPLCLMKNLNVLAPFSALGAAGILVTAISMSIRYVDGSYQKGGLYFDDIPEEFRPFFGTVNMSWSGRVVPYTCMIFEAFVMHYNSPRFYSELKNPSIPRFTGVVIGSFGFSTLMYIVIACSGYLTFGGNSDSYILNNYSPRDPLATICRLAIALSTLLTYPMAFIGFRDGMLDVLSIPPERHTNRNLNVLTVILLFLITITAMVVTDLGIINAVGGGSIATCICIIFPYTMFRKAIQDLGSQASPHQRSEVAIALVLAVFGAFLGSVGVIESFQKR